MMCRPILLLACLAFLACSGGSFAAEALSKASKIDKGDRIFSFQVWEAEGEDYVDAFLQAQAMGMQSTMIHVNWNGVESAPGVYDGEILDILNVFFPYHQMPIALAVCPIDTDIRTVPADLQDTAFDDPAFIQRFKDMLDFLFTKIPDVELVSLSIGNEVDVHLGTDAERWRQYTAFCGEVADYARSKRSGLRVGVKTTFYGLTRDALPQVLALNDLNDVILVTYYPLDGLLVRSPRSPRKDFDALVALYPDRPIQILELGYPSSKLNKSSERKQAAFINNTFRAWDEHKEQVEVVSFFMQTDWSEEVLDDLEDRYNIHVPEFRAFLGTLGLRHADGTEKPGMRVLRRQVERRGW